MPRINDPIPNINPTTSALWSELAQLAATSKQVPLNDYFQQDPERHQHFNYYAAGLTANLSRQHICEKTLTPLLSLARTMKLPETIRALFAGEAVNFTEQRQALHTSLRSPTTSTAEELLSYNCRKQMQALCNQLYQGEWKGYSGKTISDIVSIGIGGSDLGPRMAAEALTPYHNSTLNVHFVTNVDPSDLEGTLSPLDPATTLFVVTSKSWHTLETLTNAESAKQWLIQQTGQQDISQHFIGISSRTDRCEAFGIDPKHVLPMWDWVGGRFSLWSAVGLPIALATSFEHFEALLDGAHQMDKHFEETPLEQNLPVILALLEIWYVNFWGCNNVAVLPYDHTLRLLPNHLQQLTMESNGKSIDRAGNAVNYQTAPVLWGSAGTIGQHSFHQLLHQGTQMIPVDFILPLLSHTNNQAQHLHMVANCLAQAQTLMDGQDFEEAKQTLLSGGASEANATILAQHKAMPADRPSTIISFEKLTPKILGALIALYEHKTFAASVIWNINAFDQWGVELGKTASTDIYANLLKGTTDSNNPATKAALQALLNS